MTSSPVERIELEKGRAVCFITGSVARAAEAVVCSVPFQSVSKIIDLADIDGGLAEYAARVEPTAGISIDIGLGKSVTKMSGVVLCRKPPVLGCFTSNVEPAVAPKGSSLQPSLN